MNTTKLTKVQKIVLEHVKKADSGINKENLIKVTNFNPSSLGLILGNLHKNGFIKKVGANYHVNDSKEALVAVPVLDTDVIAKKLFPFQEEDRKSIMLSIEEFQSTMYVLPTGGGKSIRGTTIIDEWVNKEKRVIFITHRRKLITQMESHLNNAGIQVGNLYGSNVDEVKKQVVMVSINTAQMEDRIMLIAKEKFDYIYIDEAHRAVSKGYNKFLDAMVIHNPFIKILGVTATSWRLDKLDLRRNFQNLVVS